MNRRPRGTAVRWRVRLDGSAEAGLAWARAFLEGFDLARLVWVVIATGGVGRAAIEGRCWLPTRERPGYRIACHLPGPFPCTIVTRRPPLYRRADGGFPSVPADCRTGARLYDPRSGREWIRLRADTELASMNEALVWLLGHEGFHFLRGTRQVPGRNTEIQADAFADACLARFRAGLTPNEAAAAARKTQITT